MVGSEYLVVFILTTRKKSYLMEYINIIRSILSLHFSLKPFSQYTKCRRILWHVEYTKCSFYSPWSTLTFCTTYWRNFCIWSWNTLFGRQMRRNNEVRNNLAFMFHFPVAEWGRWIVSSRSCFGNEATRQVLHGHCTCSITFDGFHAHRSSCFLFS